MALIKESENSESHYRVQKWFLQVIVISFLGTLGSLIGIVLNGEQTRSELELRLEDHLADPFVHNNNRFVEKDDMELYLKPIQDQLDRIEKKIE